ncbi:MAG: NAD(P)/FAD-dependent oxidoreductase [Deltaproteobacteria bacterium]|nr:MAG: NAD(P)/FAD-dependent oxidoreductase [Deltaproteobacteria bacterium]
MASIAIIGSGFSGLCLGIQLKRAGIESFTIFEKSNRLGGTWRDNTYPGAACDVPSFAYCFSFEQKTDWSRKWSPQEEIRDYMEHCAQKYDVLRHIRFSTEIAGARFDEGESVWRLRTMDGEEIKVDVLVSAVGQLSRPHIPDIPGIEGFRGERFHSARWNHDVDLSGKRVAVIGNAASAIQFVPQIAPRVQQLTVFQRSANWLLPRGDRAYSEREKRLFGRLPFLARLYRRWIWLQLEMRFPLFRGNRLIAAMVRRLAERNLREQVADPRLREVLVPDYPVGGKRILISDDYYQALGRENVELVTSGIDHVTEDGIVTRDGATHPADVLIFATGFQSTAFLVPMRIEGRDGRSLESEWAGGARAYLGITVAGFPNFFMMYGPNTNLGHNSIIFMIECQTRYVLEAIRTLAKRELASLDLRPEVLDAYNARIQSELAHTVWAATGKSWYKTEAGQITNNWSGSTVRYWWSTRRFDREHYRAQARTALSRGEGPAPAEDAAAAA